MIVGFHQPLLLALRALAVLIALGSVTRAQFTWDGSGTFAAAVGSNTSANGATLSITTSSSHFFNGVALYQ